MDVAYTESMEVTESPIDQPARILRAVACTCNSSTAIEKFAKIFLKCPDFIAAFQGRCIMLPIG